MNRFLKCWDFLKQATGEGDYDRYRTHARKKHPGQPVLSAREFYLKRLQEKYSHPTRCC